MKALKNKGLRQDEDGTWWHYFKGGRRMRAKESPCAQCRTLVRSWRIKRFCSEACRSQHRFGLLETRACPGCGRDFIRPKKEQRFCSHRCAALTMHADRPVTTTSSDEQPLNADNPHYSQDERGQWWYQPSGLKKSGRYKGQPHGRTRAYIQSCARCQRLFLSNIFHRKKQAHCSRACGLQAVYDANPGKRSGSKSPAWSGGRRMQRGYVLVWSPEHPTRVGKIKPYVLEHRLVMEKVLGRLLTPDEHVHHLNGRRDDNRPENLELWTTAHPYGVRAADM